MEASARQSMDLYAAARRHLYLIINGILQAEWQLNPNLSINISKIKIHFKVSPKTAVPLLAKAERAVVFTCGDFNKATPDIILPNGKEFVSYTNPTFMTGNGKGPRVSKKVVGLHFSIVVITQAEAGVESGEQKVLAKGKQQAALQQIDSI